MTVKEDNMIAGFNHILIVGAGTMGHGLAQVFAQAGYQVSLYSRTQQTLDRADTLIKSSLDTMVEAGIVHKSDIKPILGRITPTTSLEQGASTADLALETVAENKDVKLDIFKQLDSLCPPRTLLASNTTFLNIYDFVKTSRPDKVLITHWYAPPQIIPLVDVVKGPETAPDNVETIVRMLHELGKKPVVFNRPVAGYVVSRLQIAFQREVYYLLDNDFISPQELDEAAIWGLAMRMMVVGILQRIDFGGLDLSVKNLARVGEQSTPVDYKPRKLLELAQQGALGVKAGRGFYDYKGRSEAEVCHDRDVRLLKLLKLLQETDIVGPVI
jgi:3-hydroxybutyryl-CoA dehydrogenase